MTIRELIHHLSRFSGYPDVMVRGYEEGFDIVNKIERSSLFKKP